MKKFVAVLFCNFATPALASDLFDPVGALNLEGVTAVHQTNISACEDEGGELSIRDEQLIFHYDFDHDGQIDMSVYDQFALSCTVSNSLFHGSAGAVQYWYINGELVDYSYSRGWEIIDRNLPILLRFLHGGSCNDVGSTPCASATMIFEDRFVRAGESES